LLALLPASVRADPTWPAPTDELEEIMYQLKAFRGRRFSEYVVQPYARIASLTSHQYC
jgi:hypothetical protein